MLRRLTALISTLFLLNVSIVQFVSPCETHEGEAGVESGHDAHDAHSAHGAAAPHTDTAHGGHSGHDHSDNAPRNGVPELPACCLALTSCAVTLTTCATAGCSSNDLDNARAVAPVAERENSWVTQVEPPPPRI